jgi:Methyltransferase domain
MSFIDKLARIWADKQLSNKGVVKYLKNNANINLTPKQLAFVENCDWLGAYRSAWGLHPMTLFRTMELLLTNSSIQQVVEFGSGASTQFLLQLRKQFNLDFRLDSFDHNPTFSFKAEEDYQNFDLHHRSLVAYSDTDFERIFQQKSTTGINYTNADAIALDTRGHNTFYEVATSDLTQPIQLCIVDGPNGNGRSIGFVHICQLMTTGAYILIDDYFHYDFVERCHQVFPSAKTIAAEKFDTSDSYPINANKGHVLLQL